MPHDSGQKFIFGQIDRHAVQLLGEESSDRDAHCIPNTRTFVHLEPQRGSHRICDLRDAALKQQGSLPEYRGSARFSVQLGHSCRSSPVLDSLRRIAIAGVHCNALVWDRAVKIGHGVEKKKAKVSGHCAVSFLYFTAHLSYISRSESLS